MRFTKSVAPGNVRTDPREDRLALGPLLPVAERQEREPLREEQPVDDCALAEARGIVRLRRAALPVA